MSSSPRVVAELVSPDQNAAGLIKGTVDPLRYDGKVLDADEASGIVVSMIPTGARVLDVGCATGSLSQIIADACHADVVGIEPDPARSACALARGLKVHAGYLTQSLINELGLFDIVLFADVLEHLPNPQAILLVAREALKPGGAVIISVPNVAHWSVRLDVLRGRFRYQMSGIMDATHLRWFTSASARSLLESAGFNVIEYRATAGVGLPDNDCRRPLSWLSVDSRARLLRWGCRHWPTLLGAQWVLKAEMDSANARRS